ncbi:MAG: cytochrome c oxidase subunit II [Rhodocyclaceae bacterium]|nr:cytochrome c oxidase subunit II [Rhodocyclaceae bacterium]
MLKKKFTAIALGLTLSASSLLASASAEPASAGAAAAAAKINDPAKGWDTLWYHVIRDISIIGVLFALVTAWFIWQSRRRPGNEVGASPKLSAASAVGWTVIPIFVFLSIDLYTAANGWVLWNHYRDVPAQRMEVKLESGMYSWDYTYANGVRTQNELIVPAGTPVVLRMTSRDTLHSHYIPDFRVKEDSMPGRVTYLWFNPEKPGEHIVTCAEYCGVMHGYMAGRVIVKAPEEYAAWMQQEETKLAAANAPAVAEAPAEVAKPAAKATKKI